MPAQIPQRFLPRVFGRIPLRTILVVPFVLQIVGTVGVIGYLSFQNGQKTVENLAYQSMRDVSDRTQAQLEFYTDLPQKIVQLIADDLASGSISLNATDPQALDHYLLQRLQTFSSISSIGIADEQGRFANVSLLQRSKHLSYRLATRASGARQNLAIYSMNENGDRSLQLSNTFRYDPRHRPWYVAAIKAGKPTWSKIYTNIESSNAKFTISAAKPIYDLTGRLTGVVTANLLLDDISIALARLSINHSGQVFILEPSGLLVASSSRQPIYTSERGQLNRLLASASDDPLIRMTAQQIANQFANLGKIRQTQIFTFTLQGESQFVQITPWRDAFGLNWLIVTVIPTSDFAQQITTNAQTTIATCFFALLIATAIAILTTRWVIEPILRLNVAAREIAQGKWDKPVRVERANEVGELATSFNQMATQLQTSLAEMQALNRALSASEQRWKQFLEAIPVGISVHDRTGQIVYVNQVSRQLLQMQTPVAADASDLSAVYAIYRAKTGRLYPAQDLPLFRALAGETAWADDLEVHQHEQTIPLEIHTTPIFDASGTVEYAIAVLQDISDRIRAEASLRANEARLKAVLENSAALIFSVQLYRDRTWHYEYISPHAVAIVGFTPEELSANPNLWLSRIPQADQAILRNTLKKIFVEGIFEVEHRFQHKDGSLRWLSQTLISKKDDLYDYWHITSVITDITTRKEAEQLLADYNRTLEAQVAERTAALQQSEATNRAIISAIPDLLIRVRGDGLYLDFLSGGEIKLLQGTHKATGHNIYTLLPYHLAAQRMEYIQRALQTGERQIYEYQLEVNGEWLDEEARIVKTKADEVLVIVRDITARKQAEANIEAQRQFLRNVLDVCPNAIFVKDRDGKFIVANQATARIYGVTVEDLIGKADQDFNRDQEQAQQFLAENQETMATRQTKTCDPQKITDKYGKTRWYQTIISLFTNAEGEVQGIIGVSMDITAYKNIQSKLANANRKLQRLANLDSLTQIANRRRFDEYLTQEWRRLIREQNFISLILFDVDHFKRYNDHYGHPQGDICLAQIAKAVSQVVKRSTDLFARYGGEEFAIILPNTNLEGAIAVAESLQHAIKAANIPHVDSGVSDSITLSLGIASLIPTLNTLPDVLIAKADEALYEAKRQGRDRYIYLPHQS